LPRRVGASHRRRGSDNALRRDDGGGGQATGVGPRKAEADDRGGRQSERAHQPVPERTRAHFRGEYGAYTWLKEPTRATADPKSLWAFVADGGAYEVAFGVNDEAADLWPDDVFEEALLAIISYREIERRITDIIKKDRKFLWIRRLRFFALSLFKLYMTEKKYEVAEVLGSGAMFEGVFNDFWKDAHRELISAHYDAVERDKTTVFALARSDTRWSSTREKFLYFLKQTAR